MLAVIGGTGLQHISGLRLLKQSQESTRQGTPFGEPSDALQHYEVAGRRVLFLPRHGTGHRLLASEINYRANIFALKTLGVKRIVALCAVGSMREDIEPGSFVIPDQIYDNTKRRASTFFGDGIAAYVSMALPFCTRLNQHLYNLARHAAKDTVPETTIHNGGMYLCIEGPRFSSRAESNFYRQNLGADIIGMTAATEATLAREAGICYSALACVSDYDCWHPNHGNVNVETVLKHVHDNQTNTNRILAAVLPKVAALPYDCDCANSLQQAIATKPEHITAAAKERLTPLLP